MPQLSLSLCILFSCVLLQLAQAQTSAPPPAPRFDSVDLDYSSQLPRFGPVQPAAALETFEVLPGFRWEMVASEPLVFDPVALAFDASERLFVVEMSGYSEQPDENRGIIALLEDTDRDGKFDRRTEYATGLSWPTAVWPWRDGVLVAHAPLISWFRDTDGDGKSDVRQDWFTGFGRNNVQGLVNSLCWSPRAEIAGATSSSGGNVDFGESATDRRTVNLRGRDFAIDPVLQLLSKRSGGGQHGLCENDIGERFVTSNSNHLQQIVELESALQCEPAGLPIPSFRRSIAVDGPQAEVFRSSPVEPWRTVRTRLRKKGIVPGPVEGGGRASGYFTGATGTCFLNSQLGYGHSDQATALVCDVGSNLIHRKSMERTGLFWEADRIDHASELVRSRDTWFRPVQLVLGPHSAVFVADMYRETIEHPKSLPPVIKKHLDLTSGRDRGRIYRLVPKSQLGADSPTLNTLSLNQLVDALASSDPWRRRMASQLIVEKVTGTLQRSRSSSNQSTWISSLPEHESLALRTRLESMATTAGGSENEASRVLASHLLLRFGWYAFEVAGKQLGGIAEVSYHSRQRLAYDCLAAAVCSRQISPADIRKNMGLILLPVENEGGQQHAWQALLMSKAMFARALRSFPELDAERLQVCRALIAEMGSRTVDPLICWAIAEAGPSVVRDTVLGDVELDPKVQSLWLEWLLPAWLAGPHADQFSRLVVTQASDVRTRQVWLDAWAQLPPEATQRAIASLSPEMLATCRQRVLKTIGAEEYPDTAVSLVTLLPAVERDRWIASRNLVNFSQSKWSVLIATLRRSQMHNSLVSVLEKFDSLSPTVRRQLATACVSSVQTRSRLVEYFVAHRDQASRLPIDLANQLIDSLIGVERESAIELFRESTRQRQSLVDDYTQFAEEQSVTPERLEKGRQVFSQLCAACHRLGAIGNDVGPPLRQLGAKSYGQLITAILDPSREVDPRYESFQVLLIDGTVYSGLLTDETDSHLTLRLAGGSRVIVDRNEIEQVKSSGQSLMPSGFEQQIDRDQMLSLLSFLQQSQ